MQKHMRQLGRAAVAATVGLLLSGCVSGGAQYTPPSPRAQVTNFVTIQRPLDEVWKAAIPRLGQRFFVINTIDRSSGLINVSYSGPPEDYVDCGQITSEIEDVQGKRSQTFAAAASHKVYEDVFSGKLIMIDRTMKLEGRINLIFEALDASTAKVTAATRYVLTRTTISQQRGFAPSPPMTTTLSFTSGQGGTFETGKSLVTCNPTGALETMLLRIIERGD
jgi:hypothetical protein